MDINISLLMVTADIISLMLLGTLYFSNKQRMSHDRDMECIMRMMTITAISNVVGIVFHYFNWNSGLAPKRLENRKGSDPNDPELSATMAYPAGLSSFLCKF